MQLFFSSLFPLNSQVHVQATATEEQFQVAHKHGCQLRIFPVSKE